MRCGSLMIGWDTFGGADGKLKFPLANAVSSDRIKGHGAPLGSRMDQDTARPTILPPHESGD